jgi:Raf kinase inhibitor-like YbhB/YbcL family protein
MERLTRFPQGGILQIPLLAAGAAHEDRPDPSGAIAGDRRGALRRLVVGVGVHGQEGQRGGHRVEAIPAGDDGDLRSGAVNRLLPRPILTATVGVTVVVTVLTGCDTGDGTTIEPPAPGRTAPPTTIDPANTVESSETLPTVPITTRPEAGGAGRAGRAGRRGATVSIPADAAPDEFAVFAPWADGAPIDVAYTCAGRDVAPPVSWLAVPDGTVQVAISMVDQTTARSGDRGFVHWVVAGIDPTQRSLVEGRVPPGAVQALNFFGDVGYGGPCPPRGDVHEYRLTVHALGSPVDLADGTPALQLLDAVDAATIDSRSVVGTSGGS